MIYINVGAYTDNRRIKSKAELKLMIKETPELVRFDQTSRLGNNGMPDFISLGMLKEEQSLSVCGPDPYYDRKWYAQVTVKNGIYTVK